MKGILIGTAMGLGFSVLDKRSDRIVTNALIGALSGYILLTVANKYLK